MTFCPTHGFPKHRRKPTLLDFRIETVVSFCGFFTVFAALPVLKSVELRFVLNSFIIRRGKKYKYEQVRQAAWRVLGVLQTLPKDRAAAWYVCGVVQTFPRGP